MSKLVFTSRCGNLKSKIKLKNKMYFLIYQLLTNRPINEVLYYLRKKILARIAITRKQLGTNVVNYALSLPNFAISLLNTLFLHASRFNCKFLI